ncbi:lipopolysaccharide heptosyltransferase I [Candidatus Vallotia tarda]|uniref:lipopolysaccharide heptosyltransferase I n=1 Tax=Candidatus Vallotiella hemipterorum TaxID=1177213 RepID=UPI001C1FBE1A|nr:lipopolysaccharide heptosyltransferase I [Candidatus Vallotia tarda]
MQKILIVRLSSLGDVVHNMPLVADIRRRHPDLIIDWLVEESFVELVKLVHGVRRVIPFSLRRWRRNLLSLATWREIRQFRRALATEEYDLVIDCHGLIKSAWVASWARGNLAGLGNRTDGASYEWPVRWFYRTHVQIQPHTHVVERSRQLAAYLLGDPLLQVDTQNIDFGIDRYRAVHELMHMGLNLPSPYVVFVHATSRKDKQWPQNCWIELGRALIRHGSAIVLPWGSTVEHASSEQLAQELGTAAFIPPRLSLPAVTGLIDGAAVTIGVDTGLVHISAALKKPTIELYNFATAWRTGGYWSSDIINLEAAGSWPNLSEVKDVLAGFGLL